MFRVKISGFDGKKGYGNKKWDDSVKKVLNGVKALTSAPPKNFPHKFIIRFDVAAAQDDPAAGSLGR